MFHCSSLSEINHCPQPKDYRRAIAIVLVAYELYIGCQMNPWGNFRIVIELSTPYVSKVDAYRRCEIFEVAAELIKESPDSHSVLLAIRHKPKALYRSEAAPFSETWISVAY